MNQLPKLKIKGLGWDDVEEIHNFDYAKYLPFDSDLTIMVEGTVVASFDDIIQLAAQDHYKGKEYLEVIFLPIIVGG